MKNAFSRWPPWWPYWISNPNDLIFDLQVTPMLPTKFQVNWPFGSGEEVKNSFSSHGGHLGFLIRMILAIFIYKSPWCFLRSFKSLHSGEEAKNRFSRWWPWWPSWIPDWNLFSYFLSINHSDASYQVSSQLAQGCRRSRLLKQRLTPHDGWLTLTDHNSSPWALCAQVS